MNHGQYMDMRERQERASELGKENARLRRQLDTARGALRAVAAFNRNSTVSQIVRRALAEMKDQTDG